MGYDTDGQAINQAIQDLLKTKDPGYEYDANELLFAYRTCYGGNPTKFSMDLIHAVLRQRSFYEKVSRLNWKDAESFRRAIRGYHDFLHLIKTNPRKTMVPTLEIDCVWHTHMLKVGSYRQFCLRHLGRVINHDDSIPSTAIDTHVRATLDAWKKNSLHYEVDLTATLEIKRENGFLAPVKVSEAPFGADFHPGFVLLPADHHNVPISKSIIT
ncbi:hypothetical protein BC940DRAFT_82825 [Gongronella butleri]|nr:hypothetical protein BC940DRAFT_82825 [Gongronella butleri]